MSPIVIWEANNKENLENFFCPQLREGNLGIQWLDEESKLLKGGAQVQWALKVYG